MGRWTTVLLLISISFVAAQDDNTFKVYRVVPTTDDQLQKMIDIFETATGEEADFWHAPSVVNATIDVMVGPNHTREFKDFLEREQYPHSIAIEDLAKTLEEKEGRPSHTTLLRSRMLRTKESRAFASRVLRDDVGGLVMGEYYSYPSIVNWMRRVADRVPVAELVHIGRTVEGRNITGLKFGKDDGQKRIVLIDAGIHAREWAAVHTGTYFINLIANGYETDAQIKAYLDELVIYVFPVLNPDGYEYTRNDRTNPRARMWRKSRSASRCLWDGLREQCCLGVDLNRNFGFRFAEVGASKYPCSEIYHGTEAFSEPETKAIRDFMTSIKSRMEAYITLHAYSQLWIYSYSHRKFTYPADIDDTRRVAAKAVKELGKLYGTKYTHGTGPEIIYAFSGGSTDWAKETLKTRFSYTIELRPTYAEWNGFVLDKNQLIPTAKETWQGVKVVIDEVLDTQRRHHSNSADLARAKQRQDCEDRLDGCEGWVAASPEICKSSQQSMLRDCARTCQLCHLLPERRRAASRGKI